MKTITNDIQRYLNGEGEFEGKPVLVVNNNFGVTAGQIYSRLCRDEQLGFAIGKGLVNKAQTVNEDHSVSRSGSRRSWEYSPSRNSKLKSAKRHHGY